MSDTEPTRREPADTPWGHDWWDHQITLHPPKNATVAKTMDDVRGWYRSLGHMVIESVPAGPDRIVALRQLKDASQAAIAAIALGQDAWPDE